MLSTLRPKLSIASFCLVFALPSSPEAFLNSNPYSKEWFLLFLAEELKESLDKTKLSMRS